MKRISLQRWLGAALLLSGLFCGCAKHKGDEALLARLQAKATESEHKLSLNPTNYNVMADLAVIDTAFYTHSTFTGDNSAADYKEKALSLTHAAIDKVSLFRRAELAMLLERLGNENEALSEYDKFLKEAQQSSAPTNLAANATMARELEGEWAGLLATVQTRADLLRKKFAEQPPRS